MEMPQRLEKARQMERSENSGVVTDSGADGVVAGRGAAGQRQLF